MWFPQWLQEGDRMATPAQPLGRPTGAPTLEAGDWTGEPEEAEEEASAQPSR